MNWYIGQEIVCINANGTEGLKQDKVYTIKGLRKGCCVVEIDVGIVNDNPYILNCGICGYREPAQGIGWRSESRFAPLEYDKQAIEELLENTLIEKL